MQASSLARDAKVACFSDSVNTPFASPPLRATIRSWQSHPSTPSQRSAKHQLAQIKRLVQGRCHRAQWSARKSQLLVQRYEKAGGGYRGGKSKKAKKLSTWTKQKWRTASGKRSRDTGEVYAPARTIAKLKSSPKGRKRLAAANRAKAKATRAGKQYAKHGLHKGRKA